MPVLRYSAARMENLELQRLQTWFLGVIAVIAVGLLLQLTASFMIPLVIAGLLVTVLGPIQDWFARKGLPVWIASLLSFVGLFVVIAVLGILVYDALSSVTSGLPKYYARGQSVVDAGANLFANYTGIDVRDEIAFGQGEHSLTDMFSSSSVVSAINSSLGSLMSFFSSAFVMLLFLMFMMSSRPMLNDKSRHFLADRGFDEDQVDRILHKIPSQVNEYLVLKTVISLGTGTAVWLACWACGLDFAIVWGFLAFALNYIPSIGPLLATVPPSLIAFLQFDNLGYAAFVVVVLAALQVLSGNVIEPKIMGDRLNLNIIVVLLSLFVWGLVWGFAGMILSVPLTASVNIVLANTDRFKNVSVWLSA